MPPESTFASALCSHAPQTFISGISPDQISLLRSHMLVLGIKNWAHTTHLHDLQSCISGILIQVKINKILNALQVSSGYDILAKSYDIQYLGRLSNL